MAKLCDYTTGETIREATEAERFASIEAAALDGRQLAHVANGSYGDEPRAWLQACKIVGVKPRFAWQGIVNVLGDHGSVVPPMRARTPEDSFWGEIDIVADLVRPVALAEASTVAPIGPTRTSAPESIAEFFVRTDLSRGAIRESASASEKAGRRHAASAQRAPTSKRVVNSLRPRSASDNGLRGLGGRDSARAAFRSGPNRLTTKSPTGETTMPKLQWALASMLSLSGWRLDVLLVRVTSFSRVLFVGLAWAVSPPAPQLDEGRMVIDAVFEVQDVEPVSSLVPLE